MAWQSQNMCVHRKHAQGAPRPKHAPAGRAHEVQDLGSQCHDPAGNLPNRPTLRNFF